MFLVDNMSHFSATIVTTKDKTGNDIVHKYNTLFHVPCGEGYVIVEYYYGHKFKPSERIVSIMGTQYNNWQGSTKHISDALVLAESLAEQLERVFKYIIEKINRSEIVVSTLEYDDEMMNTISELMGARWGVEGFDGDTYRVLEFVK